jgi:serine/threonine protein kinase
MSLAPNQQISEYHIVRVLGQGAFGTVYLAHDTLLDRPVAIKELTVIAQTDEVAFKRFLQEARAAGGLNHPNIVTVHALKVVESNIYLVMEYLAGGSLRALLKERGPLPVEEAMRITADMCDGLAAAHAKGIIHRDVKPENILLTENGRAKVGDFGIAHVPPGAGGTYLSGSTATGFQPGTLIYMSPEQIRGQPVDGRSDVYQVGALLYEMLAGQHYVDVKALERQARETAGANVMLLQARLFEHLSEMVCEGKPDAVRRVRPDLPEWVVETIAAALAKGAEERPTAAALARALRDGEAVRVTPAQSRSVPDIPLAEKRFERGVTYYQQGRLDEAIREFQAALDIDPSRAEVHCKLGAVYFEQACLDDSVRELRAALRIDPNNAEAHCQMGKIRYMEGFLTEAIRELQIALHIKPDHAEAHASLGSVYGFQGRLGRAADEYEIALSIDPDNAQWHYMLSTIYAEQGCSEAVQEMRIAERLGFEPAQQALDQSGQLTGTLNRHSRGVRGSGADSNM